MPPVESHPQASEHVQPHHPELQRTYTVLRAQYDRINSSNSESSCGGGQLSPSSNMSTSPPHSKIVGSHLLLSKRSSTPAGLAATANILSVAMAQHHSNGGLGGKLGDMGILLSGGGVGGLGLDLLGGVGSVANLHRRLDRSQSEPVWQQQQQQQDRQGSNSSRYKTELCRPFEENGYCKYEGKCQFAHGGAELRTLNRHPKYKTELCRTFHSKGICPYGPRCHFIHNADESRVMSPMMAAGGPVLAGHFGGRHMTGESPPPALISSSPLPLQNHHQHSPLTVTSSLHETSPTSPSSSFFDEPSFSSLALHGNLLEGLAESLASSLHLTNKVNLQASLNQLNNKTNSFYDFMSDSSCNHNNFCCSSSSGDSTPHQHLLSCLDTPPASPPDTVAEEYHALPSNGGSFRLPIFQSIHPVQ